MYIAPAASVNTHVPKLVRREALCMCVCARVTLDLTRITEELIASQQLDYMLAN